MSEGGARPRTPLRELAALFAAFGTIAFGGPAAHVAMMEDESVRRRRWMTRADFLDHLSAANLIPGPNSTELALHVGMARAGIPGLLVSGVCFVMPAVLIVGALAWAYVRYGALPAAEGLLHGVKSVVIAAVALALFALLLLVRWRVNSVWLVAGGGRSVRRPGTSAILRGEGTGPGAGAARGPCPRPVGIVTDGPRQTSSC